MGTMYDDGSVIFSETNIIKVDLWKASELTYNK